MLLKYELKIIRKEQDARIKPRFPFGRFRMIVHCLFEQSGTFKNAFKKYGIEAYDYDIQNEFGETDYVIDLFKEIEGGGIKASRVYSIG